MNSTMTIAMLSIAIQQLEKKQNTIIEVTNSNNNIFPYIYKGNKNKFKNPKLKMGHPIIQPRGQNH